MAEKEKGVIEAVRLMAIIGSVLVFVGGGMLLIPSVRDVVFPADSEGQLPEIDFRTATQQTLGGQDGFLVCPLDICVSLEPDQPARTYLISVIELRAAFFNMLEGEIGSQVLRQDIENSVFDVSVLVPGQTYPDVVTVQFFSREDGNSTLALYSRTLLGDVEPGRNAQRMQIWLQLLDSNLGRI